MAGPSELADAGSLARFYARTVVRLRVLVLLGWLAVAVAVTQLPEARLSGDPDLEGFVPPDSTAVVTETASLREFGFPLISRTILVQRDPEGLSPYDQAQAVLRAVALSQGAYPDAGPILGGLPVTNTRGTFPSSAERDTTVLTYLLIRPGTGFGAQTRAAREFAAAHVSEPGDALVGVTGSIPARSAQARILRDRLPLLETATLVVVVGIVALKFRSVVAPLVALLTAGISFVLAVRLADLGGQLFDITLPNELRPLILALVLGIATDYSIFFLSGMRWHLMQGADRLAAARAATASTGPIVAVAGLAVAAGTGVLVVAESVFFSAFGPAMALSVAAAALVSVTLVPALLAVFGRVLFWPVGTRGRRGSALARAGARAMVRRPVAAALTGACVVGLAVTGAHLQDIRLGVSFVQSLPRGLETRTAATSAAQGFAPGILAPTVLLVQDDGVASRRPALARLGDELARQPGVAGVVGPGDLLPRLERRVLTASSGDAARYLVILEDEPLGAAAIDTVDRLVDRLPGLVRAAGLEGVRYGLAGDTALADELVDATREDLGRIAVAALLANFLLLAVFLRAVVAPVFLLASSVLALAAALGALTFFFQDVVGQDGITFYVPFASAVLLLSLGSDYNIFGVGYIWARSSQVPLRQAVAEVVPATSAAITTAGVTLAASFSMLALVPLRPFRELAFVMTLGILLDALVVRSVLVPSMLTLLGRFSAWPRRMRPPSEPSRQGGDDTGRSS